MRSVTIYKVLALLSGMVSGADNTQYFNNLAFNMVESNLGRGQGLGIGGASTGQIALGIFQESLRQCIHATTNDSQRQQWESALQESTTSTISASSNSSKDAMFPLDRLSTGASMIRQYRLTGDEDYLPAIRALQQSVCLQPRNSNGGLWYYANPNNLTAYHNLSYLDGMYSYPSFAVLSARASRNDPNITDCGLDPSSAYKQLKILHDICLQPSGLLVHGYDASKEHAWANPINGASPNVWGRSLAWYTLGLVDTLETLGKSKGDFGAQQAYAGMRTIFESISEAQVNASANSVQATGKYGVWQVVDQPGRAQNFVEASSSCMMVYSLLKGVRLGLFNDTELRTNAKLTAEGIYKDVLQEFLIQNSNGTLSLNGTSSVATLSGNVDYEYYVTRPTELNSLLGTSGFIMASLEMAKQA